jgi:lysophospholipase L1-like esterase
MKKYKSIIVLKYAAIFLFCIAATSMCSCSNLLKKTEKLASNIPFNYSGLRIETRSINLKQIDLFSHRIVCFGDSVTFGWNLNYENSYPSQLEQLLKKDFSQIKVINSGIGGNTIIDANKRFDKDVLNFKPDIVIVNFGLNDGMIAVNAPNIDIKDFENYYNDLIKKLQSGDLKIIILGINPVTELFPENESESYRKKQREIYEIYNEKIFEIARKNNLAYINLWEEFNKDTDLEEYIQIDGIHPNEKGSNLIAELIYEIIKKEGLPGEPLNNN